MSDTNINKTLEFQASFFPGFYNTHWDIDNATDYEGDMEHINNERIENGLETIPLDHGLHIQYDVEGYQESIANGLCKEMSSILDGFISNIEYKNVHSPKYYNYSNDRVIFNASISQENYENISKFLELKHEGFSSFIAENFTSYDGFCSFHSNKIEDWKNCWLEDEIKRSYVISFIFIKKFMDDGDEDINLPLYYLLEDYQQSSITNYDELLTINDF